MSTRCAQLEQREAEVVEASHEDRRPHGEMKERDIIEFTHDHDFWHTIGGFFNKLPGIVCCTGGCVEECIGADHRISAHDDRHKDVV